MGVRLLLRVTAAGVGLSVSHPPDWGVAYDRAGPTPSFLSTNLTRALRSVSVDECDESLAICVVSPERERLSILGQT